MEDVYSGDFSSQAGRDRFEVIPRALRNGLSMVLFMALVGGMGLWSYRLGSRDALEVPVVRAMQGPARVQPEEPGGMQAAYQGQEINSVLGGAEAPVPRQTAEAMPVPAALTEEDGPQGELIMAAPAQLVADVLAEADALEAPAEVASDDASASDLPEDEPVEVAALSGGEPSVTEEPGVLTGFRPRSRPARFKQASGSAAQSGSGAREVATVPSGARLVQLGAFDSEQITRDTWAKLVAANGDLLSSKSLYVERTTNNARVFYRLRVAGFDNTDQTRDLCQALRARQIDCIPVTLQ